MKGVACLGQHHSADTLRSDHGFPGSPGLPDLQLRAEADGRNGGVAYAVQTAVNGGSGLLIFVRQAASDHATIST
jgi:hypothetical protein